MATGLKPRLAASIILTGALFTWYAAASAQALVDPTRPSAASADQQQKESARTPILQSVIIMPHQRLAIINGERVVEGGYYGDAQIIEITQDQVVLRSAARTETLKLYPNVQVKPAAGRTAARSEAARGQLSGDWQKAK